MHRLAASVLAAATLVAACSSSDPSATQDPTPASSTVDGSGPAATPAPTTSAAPSPTAGLRLNELVLLGSHNSYHQRPPTEVVDAARQRFGDGAADALDYAHATLTEQLDTYGLRQLELDVFADEVGGRYATPVLFPFLGLPAGQADPVLTDPGFKVFHSPGVDFYSSCPTLTACLDEVARWSDAQPEHLPVTLLIELKDTSILDTPAMAGLDLGLLGLDSLVPEPTTAATLDRLEAEIRDALGDDRIVSPAEVRGDRASLEDAVLLDGWPLVDDLRGRVLLVLANRGPVRDLYRETRPDLDERKLFVLAQPGSPDAGIIDLSDSVADAALLASVVADGYLVRTRADTLDTARAGDTERRDAVLAGGAHLISTDFYRADPQVHPTYEVAVPPLCNPVTAPPDHPACES